MTTDGYSTNVAAKLAGLTPRQLQHWDETGFIQPSLRVTRHNYRRYSFADIVALRCAGELRHTGISLQGLRHVTAYLGEQDPPRSLANSWLISDGHDVYVREGDALISAIQQQGQMAHVLFMLNLGAVEEEMRAAVKTMEQKAA